MKLYWNSVDICHRLTESLQKNEISITTTDTIPGFLANVTKQGFENLNNIKKSRHQDKPYIILVADISKLKYFLCEQAFSEHVDQFLSLCWPGPLTLIFRANPSLPGFLKSKDGTIAVRCPKHPGLLNILQNFNGLFSTSVNIGGQKEAKSIDEINPIFASQIRFLIDDFQINSKTLSSTILDFSNFESTRQIVLIREGAFPVLEIEKISGIKIINN